MSESNTSQLNIKNSLIYISGYEWGPGVSKVIFSLTHSVDQIISDEAFLSTNDVKRKIVAVYLSDTKGDHVSESSSSVTIELEPTIESSCNPFYYNLVTLQNEWASKYIVNASFQVVFNKNKKQLSFNGDCISYRICPSTELFNVRSKFTGRYKNPMTTKEEELTITYAAYEPNELKEDHSKNPLIIWIHGQGEGGTDSDIALLGNPVTYLATPKIQSYFTTKNGSNGAYILTPQCTTYWMDGGDGKNINGDLISLYNEILMDTI